MNKYILLLAIGISSFFQATIAQTVNGVPLAELDTKYIEIRVESFSLKNHVEVQIDFGQLPAKPRIQYEPLVDEYGEAMKFNSAIAVLNFMYEHGYKLSCNYDGLNPGNLFRFYILERKSE